MTQETTDLLTRLRLIAAWRTPGGPTPSQPMPTNHVALNEAADEIERLRREVADWIAARRKALSKQGIAGGHDHHDLVLLEQAMEPANG